VVGRDDQPLFFFSNSSGQHSNLSTIGFAVGFVLMMVLDVVMG
jgi:zinc transporter ZupT